jgi:peptidyl-prolyl cis-trans isomerase SurA
MQAQAEASGVTLPDSVTVRKQALKSLIFDRAATALAAQDQIYVSDTQVQTVLNQIADQNHITVPQLLAHLSQQGISQAEYEHTLKTQLIIRSLEQQVVSGSIFITPQQVDDYLKAQANQPGANSQYDVAHILIAFPDHPTAAQRDATKVKAERVYAKLQAGMNFTSAAMQYSDSGDASQGGDLGERPLSQLPTIFAQQVQNMKPGQLAGPLEDSNGYHIVLLKSIQSPPPTPHFVTEYHLQALTVSTSPTLNEVQAKMLLLRLTKAADEGVPFDTLVTENTPNAPTQLSSSSPSSSAVPGDLGWVNPAQQDAIEAQAITQTAVNHISEPFPLNDGRWRIIKVLGVRQRDNTEAYLRQQAQEALFQQQAMKTLSTWRAQLLGQCIVQIKDPDLHMAEFEHPTHDNLIAP